MNAWHVADRVLALGRRPLILGIVNVTPDSFSHGGRWVSPEAAVAHGLDLVAQGADLLDIGGESTRPGSLPVCVDEELKRVIPVVEALAARTSTPLSVDTSKSEVARQALAAGAKIINDVTALRGDPAMAEEVRDSGAGVILMHMLGTPATMNLAPQYRDLISEIRLFFEERISYAVAQGIARDCLVLDPGIGFGKTDAHNLEILARLGDFQSLGVPVCLGVSRKGLLGRVLNRSVSERLAGSLAAACWTVSQKAVQILRVHDVKETKDAVLILEAISKRTP